jgi:hypothetical protein
MVTNWHAVAFNQVPHSENEIHGDKVARDFGFKGGLVPGVTVSAYLCHPAVLQWGAAWQARGLADVKVVSPLYDGEAFAIEILHASAESYSARLVRPDGTVSATATVSLAAAAAAPPQRRGDPVADRETPRMAATPANMQQLQANGCHAVRFRWSPEHEMHTYLQNQALLPEMLRVTDGDGQANMSFVLGCSNWILARNAYMNPWVHLATRSQNYGAIALHTDLLAEMHITDLFARKGHEFVDARVDLYGLADDVCYASIDLRAIYRLRGQ